MPLGHAALAYLLYSGLVLSRTRRRPRYLACVPLAVGSQFPDLVDKPLAYVGVLSYGRSLAHSVFAFVLVSGVVWWGATTLRTRWPDTAWQGRLRRMTPAAFASGYLIDFLPALKREDSSGGMLAMPHPRRQVSPHGYSGLCASRWDLPSRESVVSPTSCGRPT